MDFNASYGYYSLSVDTVSVLKKFDGGYYGNDMFRKKYHDFFEDKLPKGMTVFYEIAGWVSETTPIMGRCNNKLVKDKEFEKMYGKETIFTYGCEPGECDMWDLPQSGER